MLIGFTGCKGVGKDTAAQFLIDRFEFQKFAFADKLKEAVQALFGMPDISYVDKLKANGEVTVHIRGIGTGDLDGRYFLQRFGTEMGRKVFGTDFWVDLWQDRLLVGTNVVVPDVRFPNEAQRISDLGGRIVEITRPGFEPDGHESEDPLHRGYIDAQIQNNGSLDDLYVDVHGLYDDIRRQTKDVSPRSL